MRKNDMVMVPRAWLNSVALLQMPLDELQEQAVEFLCEPCDEPAQQHQGEPVARVVSKHGDPEAFGEREIEVIGDLSKIPYDTPLYTHADPAESDRIRTQLLDLAVAMSLRSNAYG